MSEKVTLKSIAKQAKLSLGSVSMALNNSPLIKESTRLRVHQIAAEMGYVPSLISQIVSKKKINGIGVLLPNSTPDFYAKALHALNFQFDIYDQRSFVVFTEDNAESELYYLKMFLQMRLRGLIVSTCPGSKADSILKRFEQEGTQITFLDRHPEDIEGDFVGADHRGASAKAVQQLINAGHTRFGIIDGTPDVSFTEERVNGVQDSLKKAKIPFEPDSILNLNYGKVPDYSKALSVNYHSIEKFLAQKRPTALVLARDGCFSLVRQACQKLKLKIPDDLNLVCFDQPPPLRSRKNDFIRVIIPIAEMGGVAGRTILDHLRKANAPKVVKRLKAEVIPESTCGPSKRWQ